MTRTAVKLVVNRKEKKKVPNSPQIIVIEKNNGDKSGAQGAISAI